MKIFWSIVAYEEIAYMKRIQNGYYEEKQPWLTLEKLCEIQPAYIKLLGCVQE